MERPVSPDAPMTTTFILTALRRVGWEPGLKGWRILVCIYQEY